jgi:hypothetical protein
VLFDSRGGGGALGERASKRQMAKRYALMIGNPSGVPASEAGGRWATLVAGSRAVGFRMRPRPEDAAICISPTMGL